ncbi:MAG: glycosyltransferase family 4 protein [Pseudanabaena sp.]|jgi:glycosyltransferase involved in cell wall biosynthesis
MRILALAWEFPPRIIGGISRHVAELYPEIVKRGHEVHLITVAVERGASVETVDGIHVYRISVGVNNDFFQWVVQMNASMLNFAREFLSKNAMDLIHAHDWLVEESAIAITKEFQIPLVTTIHATEYGRCNGIHNDTQRYIHHKEIRLTQASQRVIVCSEYMRGELQRALDCPAEKTDVVYNGLSVERWQNITAEHQYDLEALKAQYAKPEEAIIYFVGRITYEKGIYILLNAMPKVIAAMNDQVRLVIIGTGDAYSILLQRQAWDLGIYHKVLFTGFMADADFWKFQKVADCAVFPSLYEPFGIVALESFAAKIPLVVSDTGGLPEVVRHQVTGIVTRVNDADSLAEGIIEILHNPEHAKTLVNNAQADLKESFAWDKLAEQTEAVFLKVKS